MLSKGKVCPVKALAGIHSRTSKTKPQAVKFERLSRAAEPALAVTKLHFETLTSLVVEKGSLSKPTLLYVTELHTASVALHCSTDHNLSSKRVQFVNNCGHHVFLFCRFHYACRRRYVTCCWQKRVSPEPGCSSCTVYRFCPSGVLRLNVRSSLQSSSRELPRRSTADHVSLG